MYEKNLTDISKGMFFLGGHSTGGGGIQVLYGKMMNVNHVWNFDPDMDIQKFLRYRRNFCTPNMPLAGLDLGISVQ